MQDELERVLSLTHEVEMEMKNSPAVANPSKLRKVESLCIGMKGVDSYINGKASKIARLASEYFSERKHKKYRGGAEEIEVEILGNLSRIRSQVDSLRGGKNGP